MYPKIDNDEGIFRENPTTINLFVATSWWPWGTCHKNWRLWGCLLQKV